MHTEVNMSVRCPQTHRGNKRTSDSIIIAYLQNKLLLDSFRHHAATST